jgi:hypothetical protein
MKNEVLALGCSIGLMVLGLSGCGSKSEPGRAEEVPPAVEKRVALFAPAPSSQNEPLAFTFTSDGVGELLREKLTPAATQGPEPVPFISEPRPWREAHLADKAVRYEFPVLVGLDTPRVLMAERSSAMRPRRVLDVPPLTATPEPGTPVRIELATGPLTFAVGPDPARPPVTELSPVISSAGLAIADPTAELSRQSALRMIDALRTEPAAGSPLGGLVLVEPPHPTFRALPEFDPPAVSTLRPSMPPLPVK